MSWLKRQTIGIAAVAMVAVVTTGCAPGSGYVRLQGGVRAKPGSFIVPANWDYRDFYKIPTTRLLTIIDSYIGVPYRWGGMSRKGMDCSGFVSSVFKDLAHAKLPRTTAQQRRLGVMVLVKDAQIGDLVFFRTGAFNSIGHVGIYTGNNRFAHASTKKGVTYSSLEDTYYRTRVAFARRLF